MAQATAIEETEVSKIIFKELAAPVNEEKISNFEYKAIEKGNKDESHVFSKVDRIS